MWIQSRYTLTTSAIHLEYRCVFPFLVDTLEYTHSTHTNTCIPCWLIGYIQNTVQIHLALRVNTPYCGIPSCSSLRKLQAFQALGLGPLESLPHLHPLAQRLVVR